ncbi:hypothetical protein AA0119_g9242 [Alternaria tenuissima]|uniref:Uncharacterized protein n=2 Tax=Alternaria alternata complex TaxID=187734 RepID=A0A4Q4N0P5_ALTAL|nr:hypothetical protein AA0115_g10976 [Alternaria tenuissima]RYN66143.1 hypothetical protein AA0117_g11943 [Alternaria alternata]RYN94332.1 hypothetical protein AA0119_g9242 [Alternaria tenuissima]RYO11243.1 hypothetical protein AA0121_g10109 [Alternaria tenuissima]
MASTNLDDGTWTIDVLKIRIISHPLFKQRGMEMPAKILEQDLKSAARFFDQHDLSSTIADGKTPRPLEYQSYTVNPDLRPMAAAASLNNTHGKMFSKAVLAQWLQRWDVDHAPRMAMFLPRQKKDGKSVIPRKIVPTQNQPEMKPVDSRKRKTVSTMPFVPQKRQSRTRTMAKDDDVEMLDEGDLSDDRYHTQSTPKAGTLTRELRQENTNSHESRTSRTIATETHLDASKHRVLRARKLVAEDQDHGPTDDATGRIGEEDNGILEAGTEQSQGFAGRRRGPGLKVTRSRKARKKATRAGATKTVEQLADEQQQKDDEEELRIYNKLRHGRYSDPLLADTYRVRNKTVLAHMEGHVRPGVKPARSEQLGTRRLYEREADSAKEEGRDLDLWMGGPSP